MSPGVNPFLGHEHRRPDVGIAEAAGLLEAAFGRRGLLTELGSHQDRNFRVDADDGRFVLKVARTGISRVELEAENAAMHHALAAGLSFAIPIPQRGRDGAEIVRMPTASGASHDLRLVTYIDGEPMDRVGYLAPTVLRARGALAAEIALALRGFDHPGLGRTLQWDVRQAGRVVEALAPFASTPARRALAESAMARAAAALDALAGGLRIQVIHADVTDLNTVAVRDGAGRPMPVGLIDFGDLSRSWLAAELAVTIAADTFHDLARPLQLGIEIARGFLPRLPLTEPELAAIWPMVVARAAAVAVSGDQQAALEPDNAYVAASREEEWAALEAVLEVPFALANEAFRAAAGMPPAGGSTVQAALSPVLDTGPDHAVPLDLSTTADAVGGDAIGDPARVVAAATAAVARLAIGAARGSEAGAAPESCRVGRRGEARLADVRLDSADEAPTVHLGVDLFAAPGTPVNAPVAGRVRYRESGLAVETGTFDVVLDGIEATVPAGATVGPGDPVGRVSANGPDGLPAHVHVQCVMAPGLDAPRRAIPSLAGAWLALSPDPSPLLALPPGLADASRPDPAALLARRERVLAGVQEHYYTAPPEIERGWRHHLVDTSGRAYVDVVNNVAVLGHSHPAVEAAVARQLRLLNTNSRFLYEPMIRFSEALAARFPAPLDTVFLVNTGSEANELALRLARVATGHEDVLALRGAYHGWTGATDAITTSLLDNPRALATRPAWVHPVEAPNPYRGRFRGPDTGPRYAADVHDMLGRLAAGGRGPAAFIAEPLYGNAGGVVLPDGYLAEVYAAVRAAGGLAIADEVQTGYARLGRHQWAFEQQGVVPDIVTVAKAAGNGMAVGAVITTRAIAEAFRAEGSFFSSVGGSPVACAAGLAVLETIDREGLQANALAVGTHLRAGLEALARDHPIIGAVHGMGLYLGVELVRDRETLEPATGEALAICERMRELGVIVQPTGDGNNVLKVKPPLCITRRSADVVLAALGWTLAGGW